MPARAGPGRAAGTTARAARHRPGLPAVVLAPRQRRPVARGPPGRLASGRPASTRSGCGSCRRCPAPRPGSRCWPAAGRPRSAPGCRSAGGPRRDRHRTVRGSTASPAARLTCRAARAGTSSAGKPGSSGCRAIPTPRPNSCSPRSAGRRPGASSWPQAWERHAEDLSVLAIGPRGPADEIAVSWDDVDAAAQGQRGGRIGYRPLPGGPGRGPMPLASPSIPTAARARPGASRTCRTGSGPRGAGTTCCRCWRWGTDSRSG